MSEYLTRDEEYQRILAFVNKRKGFRMWEIEAETKLSYHTCTFHLRLLEKIFYMEKAAWGKWRRLKEPSRLGKNSEWNMDLQYHKPTWQDWFERDHFYEGGQDE